MEPCGGILVYVELVLIKPRTKLLYNVYHRERINTEEKAKVVAEVWELYFVLGRFEERDEFIIEKK